MLLEIRAHASEPVLDLEWGLDCRMRLLSRGLRPVPGDPPARSTLEGRGIPPQCAGEREQSPSLRRPAIPRLTRNASPPFAKARLAAGEGEAVPHAMSNGQGILRMRRLGSRRAVRPLPRPYHRVRRGDVDDANDAGDSQVIVPVAPPRRHRMNSASDMAQVC
jgi:hypothetical protein